MRHLGDGLEGNAVSKATLRLAAEELAAAHAAVHYFPAYEVLNDDLRDYRFYADDLVHPSAQAIQYVWENSSPQCSRTRHDACSPTCGTSSSRRRTVPATPAARPTGSSAAAG